MSKRWTVWRYTSARSDARTNTSQNYSDRKIVSYKAENEVSEARSAGEGSGGKRRMASAGKRLHEILPATSPRLHHGRARRHRNLPGGRRLPARCPTLLNEFAFVLPTAARVRVFR